MCGKEEWQSLSFSGVRYGPLLVQINTKTLLKITKGNRIQKTTNGQDVLFSAKPKSMSCLDNQTTKVTKLWWARTQRRKMNPVQQITESLLWTYDCRLPQLTFATIARLQRKLAIGVTENKTDACSDNWDDDGPLMPLRNQSLRLTMSRKCWLPLTIDKIQVLLATAARNNENSLHPCRSENSHLACSFKSMLQS